MLDTRLSDRSFDNPFDTPARRGETVAKTAKARTSGPVRKKGATGKKSRVTMAGLLEALAAHESPSGESANSDSVAVDSLTQAWGELPKGVNSSGFMLGLSNTFESLKGRGRDREAPESAGLISECMKILEEEMEMARYVDIYRNALRKA